MAIGTYKTLKNYYSFHKHLQQFCDRLSGEEELTEHQKEIKDLYLSILSDTAKPIDCIIELLKFLSAKVEIINYTLIKEETDVIVHYEHKKDPFQYPPRL